MIRQIANSQSIDIQPGDWVDVSPDSMPADPNWGFSYQVTDVNENEPFIWINAPVENTDPLEYAPTALSLENVLDNFRKVPFES